MREPMSMVERVARIIDPVAFKQFESLRDYCRSAGDDEDEALRTAEWAHGATIKRAMGKARAAIEAMREPSEAMEEAADDPVHAELAKQGQFSIENYGKLGFASYPFSVSVWQAMIDAALSEEEEAK